MSGAIQSVVTDLMPYIVGVIVATQGWIVKQIIDLGRWRAMQDERCKQHGIRDANLEKDMPVALAVLQDHGKEMDTTRGTILQLDQRMKDGFEAIDKRLDKMERNYANAMSLVAQKFKNERNGK